MIPDMNSGSFIMPEHSDQGFCKEMKIFMGLNIPESLNIFKLMFRILNLKVPLQKRAKKHMSSLPFFFFWNEA